MQKIQSYIYERKKLNAISEGFVEKYEAILEDEARDFLASFRLKQFRLFGSIHQKKSQLSFADAIPNTP